MTLYFWRGQRVLHLDLRGNGHHIVPGQLGTVLDANTGKPLADGRVQVLKKIGQRYAIAATVRRQVGIHRWVRLK